MRNHNFSPVLYKSPSSFLYFSIPYQSILHVVDRMLLLNCTSDHMVLLLKIFQWHYILLRLNSKAVTVICIPLHGLPASNLSILMASPSPPVSPAPATAYRFLNIPSMFLPWGLYAYYWSLCPETFGTSYVFKIQIFTDFRRIITGNTHRHTHTYMCMYIYL